MIILCSRILKGLLILEQRSQALVPCTVVTLPHYLYHKVYCVVFSMPSWATKTQYQVNAMTNQFQLPSKTIRAGSRIFE